MDKVDMLISSFENEIEIQYQATLLGDYKRNNRSVKKSHRIFKTLRELEMVAKLLPLIDSKVPQIRANGALYCLPIAEELCLNTLKEIRDGDYQILSLGAEYTIKNWTNKQYYLWDD
ncbi:MAG: hypothetical protein ACJASQ_000246 [Crocinitomicaceae bacterium]|jgi:hypothetical protein